MIFSNTIATLDSFVKAGVPGYDIIVYKDGKEVLRHSNGVSDIENKTPIRGNERYNLYSCSKPITCALALSLLQNGKISLEDKLSKYMPEFEKMYVKDGDNVRRAENDITLWHLFTMTAGFSYNVNSPAIAQARKDTNGRCPTVKTVSALAQDPLLFEPGSKWEYSLCHDVLAGVCEVVSGMRFADFADKVIFSPLGMEKTTYNLNENEKGELAEQYSFENGKPVNVGKDIQTYKLGADYDCGGAGCISTVEDYILFCEGMRKGVILKDELLDMMSKNVLTDSQLEPYFIPRYGYGLGVRAPKIGSELTDFGWDGAAGSYMAIDREMNVTLFCAQHILNSPVFERRHEIRESVYKDLF